MARRKHVTDGTEPEQAMFLSQLAHAVATGNARVRTLACEIDAADGRYQMLGEYGRISDRVRSAAFTYQVEVVSTKPVDPYGTTEVPSLAEMRLLAERQLQRIEQLSSSAQPEDVRWAEDMMLRFGELFAKLGGRVDGGRSIGDHIGG